MQKAGRHEEAVAAFERAAELEPGSAEIARAIDLLLSRVQQLESHQDSADAERSDAASIDVMVDAKILAVARKVEALDSAVERLAVRLQPFELCAGTYMSLLNPVSNLFCP